MYNGISEIENFQKRGPYVFEINTNIWRDVKVN